MFRKAAVALLGLGALVNAAPTTPHSHSEKNGIKPPPQYSPSSSDLATGCSNVATAAASFGRTSAAKSASAFSVSAKDAYDCLMSVPLVQESTLEFLYQLSKFLQFQSTITYLAKPPKNSGQDPMDILGGLQDIYNAVESGAITQWYDVESRVDKLLGGTHEGHLYVNWVLPSLLSFGAPFSLVDISPDGKNMSKVYTAPDIALERSSNGNFQASAITHIDGDDVITAIEKITYYEGSQSWDTRWNSAFLSQNPPKDGSFFKRTRYPGANTFILTFENGTSTEYDYTGSAYYSAESDIWSKLTSGDEIYDRLVKVDPNASSNSAASKLKARAMAMSKNRRTENTPQKDVYRQIMKRQSGSGIPKPSELIKFGGEFPDTPGVEPYVQDIHKVVGGYFMADYQDNEVNKDVAVLDITGFAPDDPEATWAPHAVQAAVEVFLAEAKKRGMKKLIIDVRGNGGGYVNMGYDIYKQLFPNSEPYSGTRIRYHPASLRLAQAFSQLIDEEVINDLIQSIGHGLGENLTTQQVTTYQVASYASLSNLDQHLNLDENFKPFKSFEDFFGPAEIYGDKFTNIFTYNLNNLLAVGDLSYDITGYGDRASYANNEPLFKPKNIILVTDGVCASTCGIFAEFLRNQHGVRTVVVGGRPMDVPSPAVGGTRGTQVIQHSQMLDFVNILQNNFSPRDQEEKNEWQQMFPQTLPINVGGVVVNWKDNIRKTDPTQTPLQFYLEAADCRLFLTRDTLVYSHDLWNQVENLAWGSDDKCAWGDLKNAKAVMGDSKGVPISIGADGDAGTNSGFGDAPQMTGDANIDTGKWIWYGMRKSLGAAFGGRRGY